MKNFNFFDAHGWGYYAAIRDDGILELGESWPHEGGIYWRGEYTGKNMPELQKLKTACPKLYERIVSTYASMKKQNPVNKKNTLPTVIGKIHEVLNLAKGFEVGYSTKSIDKGYMLIEYQGVRYAVKLAEIENPSERPIDDFDRLEYLV